MSRSPGHVQHPEHRVQEQPLGMWMKVEVEGELLADSIDVICVVEDNEPVRYYFPPGDVAMNRLEPSRSYSHCPYKGRARYYTVKVGDRRFVDAAWSYDEPYDEHLRLQGRIAFWEEKIPGMQVDPRA